MYRLQSQLLKRDSKPYFSTVCDLYLSNKENNNNIYIPLNERNKNNSARIMVDV